MEPVNISASDTPEEEEVPEEDTPDETPEEVEAPEVPQETVDPLAHLEGGHESSIAPEQLAASENPIPPVGEETEETPEEEVSDSDEEEVNV